MRARDPLGNPQPLIRRVYSYVAYRIGEGPEAEDVTGDVFERALRYRESYDPAKGAPIAWLIGIARRLIEGSVAPRHAEALDAVDAPASGDVEEETVRRVSVAAAVAELDERDRELIALRYGADLTASQIGALLGMRTNAAEVALHRALARLRPKLEEQRRTSVRPGARKTRPVRISPSRR